MTALPGRLQRDLVREMRQLESQARDLIHRIADEIGPGISDDLRFTHAKGDMYFGAIYDLIFLDPAEGNSMAASIRRTQREMDELIVKRVELDRHLRERHMRQFEEEDAAKIEGARRSAEEEVKRDRTQRYERELRIEMQRLDDPKPNAG